jgi:hypothetical protein
VAERPEFQQKQYAFAAHIRDPEHNAAPPGIEDRRMAIYRDLFFNNLLNLLGSTFPVLRTLYEKESWRHLVRQFMVRHQAHTPYFLEIPREFIAFLQNDYDTRPGDPPFLLELAHYEWAELALSVSDEINPGDNVDPEGDLLAGVPVKSVLAWSLAYQFPVHRISETYRPKERGEHATFLVVYRRSDDELGFMELNPVTARLLAMISTNERQETGLELLLRLAQEIDYPDPDALLQHGASTLGEMRASDILLGTILTR